MPTVVSKLFDGQGTGRTDIQSVILKECNILMYTLNHLFQNLTKPIFMINRITCVSKALSHTVVNVFK